MVNLSKQRGGKKLYPEGTVTTFLKTKQSFRSCHLSEFFLRASWTAALVVFSHGL